MMMKLKTLTGKSIRVLAGACRAVWRLVFRLCRLYKFSIAYRILFPNGVYFYDTLWTECVPDILKSIKNGTDLHESVMGLVICNLIQSKRECGDIPFNDVFKICRQLNGKYDEVYFHYRYGMIEWQINEGENGGLERTAAKYGAIPETAARRAG
jgi:hypothetical protein